MANEVKPVLRFAHFHQVDTFLWYDVRQFLKSLLRLRVRSGATRFIIDLPDETAEELLLFIEEMQTLYEHPRADSRRWRDYREQVSAQTRNERKPNPRSNEKVRF